MFRISFSFDSVGIFASTLCAIHCITTPFLFLAKACSNTCCSESPIWWQSIDYLFLFISFFAIYFISKNLTKNWLVFSFWASWVILLITILNHSLSIIYLPENFIYIPSLLIIILHFYNMKFHKCKSETCCLK